MSDCDVFQVWHSLVGIERSSALIDLALGFDEPRDPVGHESEKDGARPSFSSERRTTTVDTFEQLINTGDCFTHVSLYQLLREDGRVFIFVHKILAGAGKGSFMAHPTHLLGRHKNEYVGTGKSRDKALRDCLARIKGVTTKDMADVQSQ